MNRKYGNAQTIGRNFHQNTYFLVRQDKDRLLAVMADGTIDSVNGAYAALLACETVAKGFTWPEDTVGELDVLFHKTAGLLRERLYKGRQPRVSLLAACFQKGSVCYRRAGDVGMAAFDGKGLKLLEGEEGSLGLEREKILIATRGLWQALSEIELERLLAGKGHPYTVAQRLIEEVNLKNLREQKSAAVLLVYGRQHGGLL